MEDPVNDVLKDILEFIKNNSGVKIPAIITYIGKSKSTLTRNLKQLVEQKLIEYKKAAKVSQFKTFVNRCHAK
ncbi:MAG: MarR family transcriptional regulator [Prevotella sp.]|nr:MarR family transcriptional regulator [Prevotella sp.]